MSRPDPRSHTKNDKGRTALMMASLKGHAEVLKVLVDGGADINAKDENGATALLWAARQGHVEIVKELFAKGTDINAKANDGRTALIGASLEGHAEVVKVLLAKGADVNAKHKNGMTALMGASLKGRSQIVKVLLAKGADVNAKANDGLTALDLASAMKHSEVAKLLKAHGAKGIGEPKSLSDADIWGIAVLLCVSCALFVVATVRRTSYGLTFIIFSMGIAAWVGAMILTRGNDPLFSAVLYCPLLFLVISRLTVIYMSRRQVSAPCIWVRGSRPGQSRIGDIVAVIAFLALIAFCICVTVAGFFRSVEWMLSGAFSTVFLIFGYFCVVFERVQICGNGLWQGGAYQPGLHPWKNYEFFSWKGETKHGFELWLVSKSSVLPPTRLMVLPERREAVQQLLEAKLPDRSTDSEAYSGSSLF